MYRSCLFSFSSSHTLNKHEPSKVVDPGPRFYLLDSLLDDSGEVLDDGKVLDDLSEDDQTVPDLHKVLALKTNHQGLGYLVMPLVADVSKQSKCTIL